MRPTLLATLLASLLVSLFAAPPPSSAALTSRNLELLAHRNDFPTPPGGYRWAYSACWSYLHPDGREFALLGVVTGTAIYEVTNPSNPVLVRFIPGPPSVWREMKSYRQWIYIVTEGSSAGAGVQIVRMTDPSNPVLVRTYTTGFIRSHTVSVDSTRGLLLCNGTWNMNSQTGVRVLSLADPENPVEISRWPALAIPFPDSFYVHDSVVQGNRLYLSSIGAGTLRVVDFTNPAAMQTLANIKYPGAYTHNSWPDRTGGWLYVTDESNGEPLKVFDLANLAAPALTSTWTPNPRAIVHNVHVLGDELYTSCYTEGVRICDLSDPAHPAEFAWADSWSGPSGGYNGVWEVCPYFRSGIVIASDMNSGLYIYRPQRVYALVTVNVTEQPGTGFRTACGLDGHQGCSGGCTCGESCTCMTQAAGGPASGAMVVMDDGRDSLQTGKDGVVRFAPSPGQHVFRVRRFGDWTAAAELVLHAGDVTAISLELVPQPAAAYSGQVLDAASGAPVQEASVTIEDTPLHTHTSIGEGTFAFPSVPRDSYRRRVAAPGYARRSEQRSLGNATAFENVLLEPALLWDALESDAGFSVGARGDDAVSGQWVRVAPRGTGPRPGELTTSAAEPGRRPRREIRPLHESPAMPVQGNAAPYTDRSPGPGTQCYVTGQGTDSTQWDQADVDGGQTTLVSGWYDLTGLNRPVIAWWQWFYSFEPGDTQQPDAFDGLQVDATIDGSTWTPIDSVSGMANHWVDRTFDVRNRFPAATRVRLRFVAFDRGPESTVEAAIDDITLWNDGNPLAAAPAGPLVPRPSLRLLGANPTRGDLRLALASITAGDARFEVLDAIGRRLHYATLRVAAGASELRWNGRDHAGRDAPPGLYFARITVNGATLAQRFVRTR